MEIKYDFPSRSRKYDTDEYIYDADVSDYIEEISRRHPGKENNTRKILWNYTKSEQKMMSEFTKKPSIAIIITVVLAAIILFFSERLMCIASCKIS